MPKRKSSALSSAAAAVPEMPPPAKLPRRASARAASAKISNLEASIDEVNEASGQMEHAAQQFMAEVKHKPNGRRKQEEEDTEMKDADDADFESDGTDSPLSDVPDAPPIKSEKATPKKKAATVKKSATTPARAPAKKEEAADMGVRDPEADDGSEFDDTAEEIQKALRRPPAVNSPYLPLPWKGRLGYACLNTYLRQSVPPVFSSRTCRIASILEHRHPLADPTLPEHPTKNRPDKSQPASIERGKRYVEEIGLANVRDISKMLRWNDRYGIKFMRLSSEIFPFASHPDYGYTLAPFAADALEEAGKVVAELGHRVTTHPGQFTQLGSPRPSVIENALRDLAYHSEMFDLMKLPPQQDRDAVLIMHMGGIFGSKEETYDRFRKNYARLSDKVKQRLVLENCDMAYSVHDLLPICEELNIPLCLDWHHHNIIHHEDFREGSQDILSIIPRILKTWKRKNITPKMHYSEPTPPAITPKQRRKHSNRVQSFPPCPDNMDLMIEAKDKEQAVFELMRTYRLPGFEKINPIIPYVREDVNKAEPARKPRKAKTPKKKKDYLEDADEKVEGAAAAEAGAEDVKPVIVPEEEVGMGGPENRIYWPPGMEEWLRPMKRVVKPKPVKGEGAGSALADGTDGTEASIKAETPAKAARPPRSRIGDRAEAAKRNHEEAIKLASAVKKEADKSEPGAKPGKKMEKEKKAPAANVKPDPETEVTDFAEDAVDEVKVEAVPRAKRRKSGRADGIDGVASPAPPSPTPLAVKKRTVSRPKKHV